MTTSGTISQTRFNTAKMLEKAVRRCGKTPAVLTPEVVDNALETLFMMLMSLSNRGLNLWCVDKVLMAQEAGRAKYTLPSGTQDLLNVSQSTPSLLTPTSSSSTATSSSVAFDDVKKIVRVGLRFTTVPTSVLELQYSSDNITFVTAKTIPVADLPAVGSLKWFDVDPSVSAQYLRVSSGTNLVLSNFYISEVDREVNLGNWNRDDYANQPNKTMQSLAVTNYFYEKTISPSVTLWPVPSEETRCIVIWRYRQIMDVGSLSQEIEIPSRWYEATCWEFAARLAFELPDVEPERRKEVQSMAATMTIEVERGETDNAPVFIAPRISAYTR